VARDRSAAVLDLLMRRQPSRGHGVWRYECAFGRHWTAFVQRFGVGVAMLTQSLLQELNSIKFNIFLLHFCLPFFV
jgi:hypothetical protein